MNESGTRLTALFRRAMDAEERSASRHLIRGLAAVLMAAAVAAFVASAEEDDAPGRTLLVTLMAVNGLVLLAGVTGLFGSVVSEERAAGTLPLLKLCGAGEASVLAGLAGPRLLTLASLLLLQLPFAILAMTLGGVTSGQVLGCYATLGLSGLLWCAAVTLLACLSRTASAAVVLSLGLVFVAASVPAGWRVGGWLLPLQTMADILEQKRSWPPAGFVGGTLGAAAVLSVLCVWAFRRTPLSADEAGTSLASRAWRLIAAGFGRRPRVPNNRLRRTPHSWKSHQFVTGGRAGWWVRVLAYVAMGAGAWSLGWFGGASTPVGVAIAFVAGLVLPIDVAWLAARRVRMEIEANAWETLELLPTTFGETIGGTADGTLRGATAGLFVLIAAVLLEAGRNGLVYVYVAAALGAGLFLVLYGPLLAVCWTVGTRMAIRLPATYAAAATAVSVVLFGAGLVLMLRLAGVLGALLVAGLLPIGFIWLCMAAGNSDRLLERFMTGTDQEVMPGWSLYRTARRTPAPTALETPA